MARQGGYAAIGDYAIVGDGRTAALVARDGSIDWLCLPDLDSGSVFGGLLDAERGGAFRLSPVEPFAVERRYLCDTNVVETTFTTATGTVRVTDAMLLTDGALAPQRELIRQIDGIEGRVDLSWSVEPRFGYAQHRTRLGTRAGVAVATSGADALAVLAFDAGRARCETDAIRGGFISEEGSRGLLVVAFARGEPLVLPPRGDVEARLQRTVDYWRGWVATREYDGPWREAVMRSALVLKLLIHAPSGAIAAAATTSLPESLGGVRNWDYRYSWVRDSSATLDALERLGCPVESEAFFSWLLHASQLTHPRVKVLYRLDGREQAGERVLPLAGYQDSQPVRAGNAAAPQLQLDVYGHLLQTAWLYADAGGRFDHRAAVRLAATADLVSRAWTQPDSGIWEVRSAPAHFTESKMMCWIALDRALRLADAGHIPRGGVARWRRSATAIEQFVTAQCWSATANGYERFPGAGETDASLLLPALLGYGGHGEKDRLAATVSRIRRDLGTGPLLHRYRGEDGLDGAEGAFLTCSFWLVDALARLGDVAEAATLMQQLLALANDVGLYAEELDPDDGGFLGNFPQGLVHLALINAAATLQEVGVE
ncbi:MAG TPA: glycoside hydrolase family 15 protein [Solirubrobacteraceae bacterium]|nr:glycoside hydrolase family 15 protein [Solirubrobacteraceae bacterium]